MKTAQQNWFKTLSESLASEGITDWPFDRSINYNETVREFINGECVTIYRNELGQYERPIHYKSLQKFTNMLGLLRQIQDIKTFCGLQKILEKQISCSIVVVKSCRYYHITIGDCKSNIFIQLDLNSAYSGLNAVIREFNGKNYDLYQEVEIYLKKQGTANLINYLEAAPINIF